MCNDVGEGSRCCAFYSVTGLIFTAWVGIMLQTQPFFIAGIDDYDKAKTSAFGAAAMFFFTFAVSMVGIWTDSSKEDAVATADGANGTSNGEAEYQLASDVPTYGTTH
mmetsp:Transcript_15718/g.43359  ORF Transcript_15718/g.43359 Transcript_15718/m.43359 type:complete len:108 (+) Transcript_15718:114-437(+)|eukprot:CAMPEP_0168741168 /NCGR_PEP_ID=MMETSP0724-20121128/12366_1 /TAXON_ID=265536 /ORGANISM="Amphiprora sp., Strain CCMP467" /LENGTH=107 /DNA_ID=CAMNT_0008788647 /DNA_START=105 /DNA_END=428 /DNA_ORIENTATION=-